MTSLIEQNSAFMIKLRDPHKKPTHKHVYMPQPLCKQTAESEVLPSSFMLGVSETEQPHV
ncbi:MAG: hypothetical protein K9L22_09545 [Methylococcaceae bacterium]|nr:hypothetical protein [Methylococcaceae bacterium]